MSLKSKFLTLPMKKQICLTIIVLSLFCLFIIISLCCSLGYEFLKKDSREKAIIYYEKYKDYIESCFYYQSFCLLQYEEVIRRMQRQATVYHQTLNLAEVIQPFDNYSEAVNVYIDQVHKDIINEKTTNNYTKLFFFNYTSDESMIYNALDALGPDIDISMLSNPIYYGQLIEKLLSNPGFRGIYYFTVQCFQTLYYLILSHDIYDSFRFPGYNWSIIDSPLFVNINRTTLMTFNASKIHKLIVESNYNTSVNKNNNIYFYFEKKLNEFIARNFALLRFYYAREIFIFNIIFYKSYLEIKQGLNGRIIDRSNKEELIKMVLEISGFLSSIDYSNDKLSIMSYGNGMYYYCEAKIIEDYLYYLNNRVSKFVDMVFIPFFLDNNTIISPKLSHLFLLKQKEFQIEGNITELCDKITKGVSIIDDNFVYNEKIESQEIVKDILDLNFESFLGQTSLIYQGILELTPNNPYYYIKYSYPNYNTLKEFQSDFLLLDEIDYYLFAPFKNPMKMAEYFDQVAENIFFIIVMIIIYIWILCLAINLVILYQIIDDLTEPIIVMQNTIESSSIKDETIFTYEYDDIINELFGTCKELLSGQIDYSNENGLNNFNILSIPKDKMKKIDTNIYKKNLVINNDLMNQLINEQQNMMDFSNNIKENDPNYKNFTIELKNLKNSLLYSNIMNSENKDKKTNAKDKNNNDVNTVKENNNKNTGEKVNLRYKKLFQIAEYLDYHKKKFEPNNTIVIGNNNNNSTIEDSKKSNILSKTNSKNNINQTKKLKSEPNENIENNTNIKVKMYDEQNISFLWYMEAKQKNNISFNYNINSNYDELFNDFNDECKYYKE